MTKVRIATIGTSMITGQFLEAARYVEQAQFVGAYSRTPEKAEAYTKEHGGHVWFSSLDDLAASPEVDAVYIASPNLCHAEQALKMIAAGKHVFVEKPFCTTRAETAHVMDAARDAGVIAMEAMRPVHDPAYRVIRELLDELGYIRRVSLPYGKYSSRYDLVLQGVHTNIFDPKLATGALMDLGIYPINVLMMLFGAPDDLAAFADTVDVTGQDDLIDICGSILLDYDGMVAEVAYSKCSNDLRPVQIEGEKGTLTFEELSIPKNIVITALDGTQRQIAEVERGAQTNLDVANMEFEIRDFCEAVLTNTWPERANQITLDALAVCDAVRAQEGIVFPHDELF